MKIVVILSFLLIVLTSCKSNDKKTDLSGDSKHQIINENYCTQFVAKLRNCIDTKEVKKHFRFDKLKTWIYEDCEKMRVANPQKYVEVYGCIKKNCDNFNNCLQQIMDKEKTK